MDIGVSTACFYPLETERSLELVGKSGVEKTEIFFNASCELQPNFVKKLKKIAEYYGVSVVSVHPTLSLAESFMLFSAYERRLQEGLKQYSRYGEIAAELGAKYVVMHGGKPNGVLSEDEYCERFLQISDAVASGGDAVLLQENVAKHRANELEFQKNMVRRLGERAAFCLDVKQCIRGGYAPSDMLAAVEKNVKHLHISDNNGTSDCLLPGMGCFDFLDIFSKAVGQGFTGSAIIEVYRWSYGDECEVFDAWRKISQSVINKSL